MKMDFKKTSNFSFQEALPVLSKYFKWSFVTLFFVAFGAGMYDWYLNVYKGDWTDAEKQRYAETAFSETVFKEDLFRKVVSSVSKQAESYATDAKAGNDFFKPLPKSSTAGQSDSTGR